MEHHSALLVLFSLFHWVISVTEPIKVICSIVDHIPDRNVLDEVCTDLFYKVPKNIFESEWESSSNILEPLLDLYSQHPNLRFYMSIQDVTFYEPIYLIHHLTKLGAVGLDVIVNPETDVDKLQSFLKLYQPILNENYLSLTLTTIGTNLLPLIDRGIIDLVDNIFYVQTQIMELGTIDWHHHLLSNVTNISNQLVSRNMPFRKFIIGLPTVLLSCAKESTVEKHEPELDFRLPLVEEIAELMDELDSFEFGGVLLFDIDFNMMTGPVCLRCHLFFIGTVWQAESQRRSISNRVKRSSEDLNNDMMIGPTLQLQHSDQGSKRKILIFSGKRVQEEDEFQKISPANHIVLGYDRQGNIYDIYHRLPEGISLDPIVNIVNRHSLHRLTASIWSGTDHLGEGLLQPPNINILLGAATANPVLLRVSWVKTTLVLHEPINTSWFNTTTTTTAPAQPATRNIDVETVNNELRAFLNFGNRKKYSRTKIPAPVSSTTARVFGFTVPTSSTYRTITTGFETNSVDRKSLKTRPAARPTLPPDNLRIQRINSRNLQRREDKAIAKASRYDH